MLNDIILNTRMNAAAKRENIASFWKLFRIDLNTLAKRGMFAK